jgi:hypothetical protein
MRDYKNMIFEILKVDLVFFEKFSVSRMLNFFIYIITSFTRNFTNQVLQN